MEQRAKDEDLNWALPLMRAGYAGRGIVYVAVAGLSLWAIWSGGQAEGTEGIFARLETSAWGMLVLVLIAIGLFCYAAWRLLCAAYDLEDYGDDAKGMIARAGQVTTGVIHAAIGVGALLALIGSGGDGGKSSVAKATEWVMGLPAGPTIVVVGGAITIGAGLYYLYKAWTEKYRRHLMANEFTLNWNWLLKTGVVAQAAIITIVGCFILYAGMVANPDEAGGLGQAFDWLREQAYGRALVIAMCLGLLAFALFCFVNAMWRIVPKLKSEESGIVSLREKLS